MTIARRAYVVAHNVPANTPLATPNMLTVPIGWAWVWDIIVRVPAGSKGTTGYAFVNNNVGIAPWATPPSYYVGDNEENTYTIDAEMDAHTQLWGYNTDIYAHTFYWRIDYTPIALMTPADIAAAIVAVV